MRFIYWPLLSIVLVFAFAACKNNKQTGEAVSVDLLNGTDWELFMIEYKGKKQTAPSDGLINLTFANGRLNGKAICNDYAADYVIADSTIKVESVVATEKFCNDANWDAQFLSAIQTAKTFTLNGEILKISCSNGANLTLSKRMIETIVQSMGQAADMSSLLAMFPDLRPDQMHLYSILLGKDIDVYPFIGETITPNLYPLFDEKSAALFKESAALGAYAIGKVDSIYIVRIPGGVGSNTLAMYFLKNNKLVSGPTLAFANQTVQQDAWIKDLDRDGDMEVVLHRVGVSSDNTPQELLRVIAKVSSGVYQPNHSFRETTANYPVKKLQ